MFFKLYNKCMAVNAFFKKQGKYLNKEFKNIMKERKTNAYMLFSLLIISPILELIISRLLEIIAIITRRKQHLRDICR